MLQKKIVTALIALSLGYSAFGQEKIKARLADDYFSKYSFVEAIPIYQDLAVRNDKNTHYISRTAECYRLTGNTAKAEEWYAKLAIMENASPDDLLMYAEMLEGNRKYDEAQKYFALYNEKSGTDSRGKRKTSSAEKQFNSLFLDSASFLVSNLPFNSENSDFGLFPFGDKSYFFSTNRKNEKEKYVKHIHNWNNQPFLDLYTVKKKDDGSFASPEPIPGEVNSQYHEGPIFFDKNNNTFYITRNNFNDKKFQKSSDGVNKLKLYMVNIDGTANRSFEEFEYNNNEYSAGHAALSSDGQRLYFSSDMPGGYGSADIYVSIKEGDKWGKPQNLGPEINTEGNEMFPFIATDNKLYYSSDGHFGLGGLDIYSAELEEAKIKNQKNLGYPVNSNKDDFAFYIADDNKTGFLSSNREGGKGNDDIYAFTVLKKNYFVSGKAIEKETGNILAAAKIFLVDDTGNPVGEIMTEEDGSFRFEIEPGKNYTIRGEKESYYEKLKTFSVNTDQVEFIADLPLEKKPELSLVGLILDKTTKTPLENVSVVIIDKNTGIEFINLKTPMSGGFGKPLEGKKINDTLNYEIKIEKEGYLGKTIHFSTEITKPGEIKLHEALDIALDKIEIGTDIGKLIDIKPIYFDLGKWSIRKDATSELDKIVKVMNENLSMEIELGSHTDCRSGAASNLSLSDKRAKASAEYIKKKISNPARIFGKGYGESQLVNKCECESDKKTPCTEEEHQMNRRTEFKVIKY